MQLDRAAFIASVREVVADLAPAQVELFDLAVNTQLDDLIAGRSGTPLRPEMASDSPFSPPVVELLQFVALLGSAYVAIEKISDGISKLGASEAEKKLEDEWSLEMTRRGISSGDAKRLARKFARQLRQSARSQ